MTAAGRRRVDAAFQKHGLLLVQGQYELPSIADLLAGKPITTRGYSWDYVPAWTLREELAHAKDAALVKLFRGMNTLVHRRHWPAVDALARAGAKAVRAGKGGTLQKKTLTLIEKAPGITGNDLRVELTGKKFQKIKNELAKWLCIVGEEQEDAESHTHDQCWYPWAHGKISHSLKRRKTRPELGKAADSLLATIRVDPLKRPPKHSTLLPVTRLWTKK